MIFAMAVSTIFLVNAFMVLQHPELRATDGETLPNSTGFQADEICSTLDKERIWNEIPKCIPRDTLVSLPPPEDETILEFFPSQVMVPRCSGGCHLSGNHQHKCLPVPKSRYQKPIQVIAKRGSQTFNCSTIELEAHRDCRCGCEIDASNCSADQVFVQTLCQCQCRDFDEQNKCQRTNDKFWDRNSCQCLCLPSVTKECSTGYNFDSIDTCINGLVLNASKTQPMFGGNIKTKDLGALSIDVNVVTVNPVEVIELLGVKFDTKFSTTLK
eukprot:maker-scaffold71_size417697-snap-gene-2.16 protein:Tk11808 transcript:maker-scaffold71_size417697-snap-gene-2.16-mRNA-1 annotation:"GA20104"